MKGSIKKKFFFFFFVYAFEGLAFPQSIIKINPFLPVPLLYLTLEIDVIISQKRMKE